MQGQGLRDRSSAFEAAGVEIVGASFDTVEANRAFAAAQEFGYRLLSDTTREVGRDYEVLRDPTERYAATPQRVAYLIDPEGLVRRSYAVTDVAGFADDVLADLAGLA